MRDGAPLPGLTPVEVLSQLVHRVFGPLHADRTQVVLDYHGAAGRPAGTLTEVAARHQVTTRTVSTRVRAVRAAGNTLPLSTALIAEVTRRTRAGEDHLARTRTARTLGLPAPAAPERPPVLSRNLVSPNAAAAARTATRILTTVGSLDLDTLYAAVQRSRRFRHRNPLTTTELDTALLVAGAVQGPGRQWQPPPFGHGVLPARWRAIVTAGAGRDLTRGKMIDILIAAGYSRSSATGRMSTSHPLFRRVGPDHYRIIGTPQPDAPPG